MQAFYPAIKHTHILLITFSIILFQWRFWQKTCRPHQALPRALKILPHINDTLLLFSGMMLMHLAHFSPITSLWLGGKLLLVIAYIVFGIICLRAIPKTPRWWIFYALSTLSVCFVIYLARFKPF